MADYKLPEGFTAFKLPQGFSLEPKEEPKAPPGPGPQEVEDPFEAAAMRTRAPFSRRGEGPVTSGLEKGGLVLGNLAATPVKMANKLSELVQSGAFSGTLSDNPDAAQQAIGAVVDPAMLALPGSAARQSGKGIAQLFAERHLPTRAKQELGVDIAKGMETRPGTSQILSRIPFAGAPLRRAGEKTGEQLGLATERAAARPAGRVVSEEEAGIVLKDAIRDAFREGRLDVASGDVVASRLRSMGDSASVDTLLSLAGSKRPADKAALGAIRLNVPTKDWELVQSATIQKLAPEADPIAFAHNWRNLSKEGKTVLFTGGHAKHLDLLAEVAGKYGARAERTGAKPEWHPLALVADLTGGVAGRLYSKHLAKPAATASVANWTRSYDRLISNPSPGAMAAFGIATRNLSNTLGEDFSLEDVLTKMKEGR